MRVVMPLFDFINRDEREFAFGDGTYCLRRFDPDRDIPKEHIPGLSEMDREYIKLESWALVAENPNLTTYREDINRLLLSFKIHTLARLFVKYRVCADDMSLSTVITERMTHVLAGKSPREITAEQLEHVNTGFERLQEMDAIHSVSNRTHNAIYFMYGAYFTVGHVAYLFILLFTVLEALFSKDGSGAATRTICERVSSFLDSQPRCTYADIQRLYNIRSELVHGRRRISESTQNLADAHELEFVVTECMKKMLAQRIYLKYKNATEKEAYFSQITKAD